MTWYSARKLAELLDAHGEQVQAPYNELLLSCDRFFSPLSDPLRADLGLHAWLAPEREESYSKWLCWTLKQFADCDMLGEIFDLVIPAASQAPRLSLDTEWTVRSPDRDRSGRIDVAIWSGTKPLAILEIKTKPFNEEALDKHRLYCKSPDVPPDAAKIFIAQTTEGFDLRGFRYLSWKELCLRLRERMQVLMRDEGYLVTAMVMAFVAAVEQNLLGVRPFSGHNYFDIPTAATYLEGFIRRIALDETDPPETD